MKLLMALVILIACSSDSSKNNISESSISINVNNMSYTLGAGSQSFSIQAPSNVVWGIRTDATWLSVSKTSGRGNESIIVESSAYNGESTRTTVITVFSSSQALEIRVKQEAIVATLPSDSSEMSDFTAVELSELMGVGWNVGNSLEAIGGETAWGNPRITEELINTVKSAGFKTVRIPVAWSNYIEEGDEDYTINEAGLNRVEEVVNFVLDNNMFAIVNIHWDGGWMQPTYEDQDYVNERLNKMWQQIAIHFRNYDYHLIFAGTNEVMVKGDYGTPTEEYYTVQNSFNQTFIHTVRETGGRNTYRFLAVQGFNTNIDHTVNFAEIPEDTIGERMFMEVHYYDPYQFTLDVSNDNVWQWGEIATDDSALADWGDENWLESQFQKMYDNFVSKGIGVILGEYGASYRANVEGAEKYRKYYYEKTTESALEHGMVPIIWDNGSLENHQMGLFNRNTGNEELTELIDAITEND